MGSRLMHFSDISGKAIADDQRPARVLIIPSDARKGMFMLEALDDEVKNLVEKAQRATGKDDARAFLSLA